MKSMISIFSFMLVLATAGFSQGAIYVQNNTCETVNVKAFFDNPNSACNQPVVVCRMAGGATATIAPGNGATLTSSVCEDFSVFQVVSSPVSGATDAIWVRSGCGSGTIGSSACSDEVEVQQDLSDPNYFEVNPR